MVSGRFFEVFRIFCSKMIDTFLYKEMDSSYQGIKWFDWYNPVRYLFKAIIIVEIKAMKTLSLLLSPCGITIGSLRITTHSHQHIHQSKRVVRILFIIFIVFSLGFLFQGLSDNNQFEGFHFNGQSEIILFIFGKFLGLFHWIIDLLMLIFSKNLRHL